MQETLIEIYQKLKNNEEPDLGRFSPDFILDCYKYGWLKEKPSKKHKKWFEEVFECKHPEYLTDISKSLEKELKGFIKKRKQDEKREEKWKQQRYKRGYSDADCWNIYSWFLEIMPKMLQKMRDNLHGFPADFSGLMQNSQALSNTVFDDEAEEEPGFVEWKKILDRMIFLLKEMDEETCSYKNEYEEEYFKQNEDFRKKYGWMGEKLKSEEELAEEAERHSSRMYSPKDFPDLYPDAEELSHQYFVQEMMKHAYIEKCREEFFNLFSKHFFDLWD